MSLVGFDFATGTEWNVFRAELSRDPRAVLDLAEYMSEEISEEQYCATWLSGVHFWIWAELQGGTDAPGDPRLDERDRAELKRLSEACGGWVAWERDPDGPTFFTAAEWAAKFDSFNSDRAAR